MMESSTFRSEKIDAIAIALSKAQSEIPSVPKRGKNPHFKSKYALLDDIIEALRPVLPKYNLGFAQFPLNEADMIGVETLVFHGSGQLLGSRLLVKPVKSGPQDIGSLLTYLKRYTLGATFGIATDDDDDGNVASGKSSGPEESQGENEPNRVRPTQPEQTRPAPQANPAKAGEPISEAQGKRLFAISRAKGWQVDELKTYLHRACGVNSTKDILRKDYEDICFTIENKPFALAMAEFGREQNKAAASLPFNDGPTEVDLTDIPF